MSNKKDHGLHKLSLMGVVVTLGVVYGDIGTSPLYVMNAIISAGGGDKLLLIRGALSLIFWTLTLQTTIKYVLVTLRADNKGEGGIFALYALIRRKGNKIALLTMIGGSALLADGVITPAITVTSSIEGLGLVAPHIPIMPVVLLILGVLFAVQRFGTNLIGTTFGFIMVLWFSMLGILGANQIIQNPSILVAFNPMYAYQFLMSSPIAYLVLGAVFLSTTGAEALYSDLGHCGIKNIRASWIFVKTTLILNYFGQGAWLLNKGATEGHISPFYGIMPEWFLYPGIALATMAAIIASQALISGSFTLISEAVSLNFWPKTRILHPTKIRGQVYIPGINWSFWFLSSFVVLYFQESSKMEAAYGLSITITMMITTLLLTNYLYQRRVNIFLIGFMLTAFLTVEGTFFYANVRKFMHGGWLSIAIAFLFFLIMYGWYFGRKIKNLYISFAKISDHLEVIKDLSQDQSVPKIAANLVYITKANRLNNIESKIIYSIINKQPKRADMYWFLHVDIVNDPYTFEYRVHEIVPGVVRKVDFTLGFKIEPRINLYFREVIEDLVAEGELNLTSKYASLAKHNINGDFLFVNLSRVLSADHHLTTWEKITLDIHWLTRLLSITDVKALWLDSSNVITEKVPITFDRPVKERIKRYTEEAVL